MASVTLTIPSPILSGIETFGVIIKDGSGMTVFSSTETNAPFTVSGLSAGDFVAYYTFGSDTNQWCFTIPPCGCPDLTSAVINSIISGYEVVFTFDFSSYTPDDGCSFVINGIMPDGSTFQYAFTTIFAFVSIGGGLYTLTAGIGSNSSCTFYINQWIHGADTGIACFPTTNINYSCSGPLIGSVGLIAIPPPIVIFDYYLKTITIDYSYCGSSCHTVMWNYIGTPLIGAPDVGTFTDTVTCSPLGITTHTIRPSSGMIYNIVGTDCCGNTYRLTYSCISPILSSLPPGVTISLVQDPSGSDSIALSFSYPDSMCLGTCYTINYAWRMFAPYGTHTGTFSQTFICSGGHVLPIPNQHLFTDASITPGTFLTCQFTEIDCCGYGNTSSRSLTTT